MESRIILVDRDDTEIGAIDRFQLTSTDLYRVAALWLTDPDGNILIAQRKLDKPTDPGKWGPAVAGTVEVGETYESNIYKEAHEEIGLLGIDFQLGPHQLVQADRSFHCQWFVGMVDNDYQFNLQVEEVEKVSWISPGELKTELALMSEKYLNSMGTSAKLFGI